MIKDAVLLIITITFLHTLNVFSFKKKSNHFDGTHFSNIDNYVKKNFLDILKWRLFETRAEWPVWVENKSFLPPPKNISKGISYTFINHATVLIQLPNLNIITDPIYSKRASPFGFIGPKRIRKPGVSLANLPKIDLVLISHNHYDHMDLDTLKILEKKYKPTFLVGLGNKEFLEDNSISNIKELDWWEDITINNKTVVFVPAHHFSGRGLFDHMKTLWGGFIIIEEDKKLFFAGDTGYSSHFKKIRKKYDSIDLAFIPIGAYKPRSIMKSSHLNPEEAVTAHIDLNSSLSIGIHFETFSGLTDESFKEPAKKLSEALKKHKINKNNFLVPKFGKVEFLQKISPE